MSPHREGPGFWVACGVIVLGFIAMGYVLLGLVITLVSLLP